MENNSSIESCLENDFKKEIEMQGLVPNSKSPGEFIVPRDKNNKLNFLAPENWVFHEKILKNVLAGKYEDIRPYSAEFVPSLNCTNRCNGPCSYCLQRMNEGIATKNNFKNLELHMSSLHFAKIMADKIIDGGVKGITFTGGGEPSLFLGLDKLMQYVSGRGVDMVLYSNGNSWNEERIQKVCDTSPLLTRISLNCGTKEDYNKFHKPFNKDNAFDTVINSISNFAKYTKKNPKSIFGVSFIINQLNFLSIPKTANILRDIARKNEGGISFAMYRPAFNYNGSKQTPSEVLDFSYSLVENEVKKTLVDTGIEVINVKCRYDALRESERGYKKCRATGIFAELGPSGQLYSCCDRNAFRAFSIGDLKTQTFEEIYSGQLRKDVLDYANDYNCTTCPIACKPHETNKQFEKIEKLREKGEIYKVKVWADAYRNFKRPRLVNF